MTADVTREPTGGQGLREAVGRASWDAVTGYMSGVLWERAGPWQQAKEYRRADAVLALPELAALIADADNWRRVTTGDPTQPLPLAMQARELLVRCRELEATVRRVETLYGRLLSIAHDSESLTAVIYRQNADRLRRALDGEPQP